MQNKQNNSLRASALEITLISTLAVLLTLGAAPARNQLKQKPTDIGMAAQDAHRCAAVSESVAEKRTDARESARVEFSASRQRVGNHEIAGFTARQARTMQEENLMPPAGLKPVEQEAWLAMARRQSASMRFASFYPKRYGEAFVVQGEGVRVAVRPVGGMDAAAQIDNGQVIYRNAYPETDSVHVVGAGRSEEFLFLQAECAPREFAYELREVSAGTRVELINGEVHFTDKTGHGVKIEAPWLIEAKGEQRAGAVHWELEKSKSGALLRLRLVVAKGLRYPVLVDPSWVTTGSLSTAREIHTATLLQSGKVLVAGGTNDGINGLSSAELYDPATGMWSSTGSLGTARYGQTATLLQSGKVLVTGGYNAGYLNSAELYDPATGMWSGTGDLGTARYEQTATLLPSGKVLVAAGYNGGYLNSAELYDPATGMWSGTGDLGTARYEQTATLLSSGKVLVAAGYNSSNGALSSAELYDPATGSWSGTGSLSTARDFPTATLLPSGKVLVAGGQGTGFSDVSSAELYDPASGTWSGTGSMSAARVAHTATLLPSGKVLVAGGFSFSSGFLSSAELYDPATGSWSSTGSLGTGRYYHTAALLPSGKVLVAGGFNPAILSSAELYDPASGSWSSTGSLATARAAHTATLLPSGKVLVVGGDNGSIYFNSAELYDPVSGTWTATGSLSTAREFHTATLLPSGKVLVAGGFNGSSLSSAELYDPAANGGVGAWSNTGNLGATRDSHTATLLPSGKVLVAGGEDSSGSPLSSAELYDPAANGGVGTWSSTGSLATARVNPTATLLPSGKVLVAAGVGKVGFNPVFLSSAELYDPVSGTWTATGSLSTARWFHTATLLPSGKVLVAAGFTGNPFAPTFSSAAELYDPAANGGVGAWSNTGSLGTGRVHHTATLLPSGKVLVAGGAIITGELKSAELYDPALGTWSNTGNLGATRERHTATLLPSGKVLVAAGFGLPPPPPPNPHEQILSSAELYDQGLGFDSSWQPSVTTVSPSTLENGGALTASGSQFKGISEASGGNGVQNSSSNYPVVQLLSLANEQTLFLPVDTMTGWSDTSFSSTPITMMTTSSSGFPVGYAMVTVFTNGIPSQSQFVVATGNAPSITAATISRAKGQSANSQIATVSDNEDPPTALTVTVNGGTSAIVNGVAVSNIAVANSGNVTADVAASCSATNATFTLRVTDTFGLYAEAMLTINVTANTTAPVITPKAPTVLQQANNHGYRTFTITQMVQSATDDCDGNVINNVVIEKATSDEVEDSPGGGDGNTRNDIVIAGNCKSVQLRQERDGGMNGRVYLVTLRVGDSSGNIGRATYRVSVQVGNHQAVDSGVHYTVLSSCQP